MTDDADLVRGQLRASKRRFVKSTTATRRYAPDSAGRHRHFGRRR